MGMLTSALPTRREKLRESQLGMVMGFITHVFRKTTRRIITAPVELKGAHAEMMLGQRCIQMRGSNRETAEREFWNPIFCDSEKKYLLELTQRGMTPRDELFAEYDAAARIVLRGREALSPPTDGNCVFLLPDWDKHQCVHTVEIYHWQNGELRMYSSSRGKFARNRAQSGRRNA